MSSQIQSNYIDLKLNGRLFPLWILQNFRKYKLNPIVRVPGQDPCDVKDEVLELRNYQKFAGLYMDHRSPYKNILLYHGLGSGKTATAINVYNLLYNYNPNWNVFIIIKASLRNQPWMKDLKTWLSSDDNEGRWANIRFVHYDAPRADRDFLNKVKLADSSKKNIYIFDEAHNFIKNVYNNMINKMGKRAQVIYDYIIQEKKENDDNRVILISATPAVNTPYELALIFNLLRPDTFPNNEQKFNEIYISNIGQVKLNPETKNMFQRRIIGLVSYYKGSTSDLYARKDVFQKNLVMAEHQLSVYKYNEEIERKLEANKKPGKNTSQSVYKSYTRQASNFVFPVMGSDMSGENRPRPGKFRLSEKDAARLMEGKTEDEIDKEVADRQKLYLQTMDRYINSFDNYLGKIAEEDKKQGLSLDADLDVFKTEYSYKFTEFWNNYKKKSNLLVEMYECSCKMTAIMFYCLRSKGPILVYSNYVKMEGLQMFKIYMKHFGFSEYGKEGGIDFHRFTEFSGDMDKELRNKNLTDFNNIRNKDGSVIRIILISPAGSEGISLRNVRQVHVMEPYWNEVRIEQLIGRAVRACYHKDIPIEDRIVEVYRYNAIVDDNNMSTDQKIQEAAFSKQQLIDYFLNTIKEVAVDCELYKDVNMEDGKYSCFKFNERSYFDKYVLPAYKDDIYYDKRINNGLNSVNSIVSNVKVVKIKYVKIENGELTQPNDCWYNPITGVVYDYELKFPFAKVRINSDGVAEKIDKITYIVDNVIVIPKIRNI